MPAKQRLRNFAEQMGVDARTAYKALSDAHDILNGKYMGDAKFYDVCTRVAIGVKTAAKVGVFVCATAATGGAAAAGMTAAQATGLVVSGVDCAVDISRSSTKIVLGDDHKLVQMMENSTLAQVYDTTMFLYGVATFDPKTVSTGEKLLFIEDLAEKNIATYENVKVLTDEATGLAIDRIEGETKKIAAEYTRIQSDDPSDLAPAAKNTLGAENTGILGIDPSLRDGTAEKQKKDFTDTVDSSDLSLAKTYTLVKDGDKTLNEKIDEFKNTCDEQVSYQSPKTDGGTGGGSSGSSGGGSGGGTGSGSGGESGDGGSLNLPHPTYDYDEVRDITDEDNEATDYYYKNGEPVGKVYYRIDENGRYWPQSEEWLCENGDWLITEYYRKDGYLDFEWCEEALIEYGTKRVVADKWGCVRRKYAKHYFKTDNSYGYKTEYYDTVWYYPTGQIYELRKRTAGQNIAAYMYSPEGRLYEYQYDYNEQAGSFNYEYSYFVYRSFIKNAPFDPTGHLMYSRESVGGTRTFKMYGVSGENVYSEKGELLYKKWGYKVYTKINAGDYDYGNPQFICVTTA